VPTSAPDANHALSDVALARGERTKWSPVAASATTTADAERLAQRHAAQAPS